MFGMNAKDAQRALEDITIFNNIKNATEDNILAAESESDAATMQKAVIALRERAHIIQELRSDRDQVQHNRNVAAILAISASNTLDHVLRDFARSAGVSEEALRKRYNVTRTQYFNQQVNEGIGKGWFQHDPRTELSETQKQWYVPKLDADHGF